MKTSKRKAKRKADILDKPRKMWLFKTLGVCTCVFCRQSWPCLRSHRREPAILYPGHTAFRPPLFLTDLACPDCFALIGHAQIVLLGA